MSVTTHDIEAEGKTYILEWTHSDDERDAHIAITETCDDTPCEWFVNNATDPSWCCNTHQYDGTGDYPASGDHPEVCDFSDVDEDGECRTEHETYDFTEYGGDKHFNAILAKNAIAEELADYKKTGELNTDFIMRQLRDIEQYTGEMNQPSAQDTYENS